MVAVGGDVVLDGVVLRTGEGARQFLSGCNTLSQLSHHTRLDGRSILLGSDMIRVTAKGAVRR